MSNRQGSGRRFLLLAVAIIVPILVFFVFAPTTGIPTPKYCTVNVTVSGTFQSTFGNYITGLTLAPTEGSCYGAPLPSPGGSGLNILPYSFQGTLTMAGQTAKVSVNVPALQFSYPFTSVVTFNGVSPGTYQIVWTSPLLLNGPWGNTYSQTTSFTVT